VPLERKQKTPQGSKTIAGGAGGALLGWALGGPIGSVVGGVVGLLAGVYAEEQEKLEQ